MPHSEPLMNLAPFSEQLHLYDNTPQLPYVEQHYNGNIGYGSYNYAPPGQTSSGDQYQHLDQAPSFPVDNSHLYGQSAEDCGYFNTVPETRSL